MYLWHVVDLRKHVHACAEALEVPEIPYFFDQTPWLLLFSLIIFVQLLFEGGVYFFGKLADINDGWIGYTLRVI